MYYKYDFFFDNCATRVRDIFPRALGKGFVYGSTLPKGSQPTFRDIINQYFHLRHWERVGVNILLGSKIDKKMTDAEIMFLPDFLRDGLAGAKLNGRVVATPSAVVLTEREHLVAGTNQPLILTCILLLLTALGVFVKKLRLLGRVMSVLLLFVTGLLGCLVLAMWFGTDHQGCSNNYNLLWALPVNLFIAFTKPRGKGKYAVIAMGLIVVSLLLHVAGLQGLVLEFVPLLLALFLVHWRIYSASKEVAVMPVVNKSEPEVVIIKTEEDVLS